ncbi:MAG: alpha/beta hydrolase [Bacilli bacterium]
METTDYLQTYRLNIGKQQKAEFVKTTHGDIWAIQWTPENKVDEHKDESKSEPQMDAHPSDELNAVNDAIANQQLEQTMSQLHTNQQPCSSTKTALVLHGYLDHTGCMREAIVELLEAGYTVYAHDLIGHGRSSGEPHTIKDFAHYADTTKQLAAHWGVTHFDLALGHSTGCAVLLEIERHNHLSIGKHVYLAPLVRSAKYHSSVWLERLARWFVKKQPRGEKSYHNQPDFIAHSRQDELMGRWVKLEWFRSMRKWYESLEKETRLTPQLVILQGTDDRTVDWKYNVPFLQERFPSSSVYYIEDASHQPLFEKSVKRAEILRKIREVIVK